jgi:iron(III) transport system ATP-binding protein
MPHELSGGQQQRVALARALAAEPELVLLDEPFSNLDPSVREEVRGEVRDLLRNLGITAVIVTHDQEEALSLAGKVAVMMDGMVLQTGTPAEVYGSPVNRAVAEFVGGANVLPGRATAAGVECVLGVFGAAVGEGDVDLMFRAETLAMSEEGVPAEVVDIEYYGHDQMVKVKLQSGETLRLRLMATPGIEPGKRVGITVKAQPLVYPHA